MEKTIKFITRAQASEMLRLSMRTIDRYIRKKGIKTRREGKNLLILESDILPLMQNSSFEQEILDQENFTLEDQETSNHDDTQNIQLTGVSQELLIKKFLEQTRAELMKKDEKIEMLQYKVGQLETRLEQSVPLLEHNQSTFDINEKENLIRDLNHKNRHNRIIKNLYLIFVIILALAFPITWIFTHS